jgi:hypothetical protein
MPRRVRLTRRNPSYDELPYDEWIPAHAIMFNDDGTISVMTEADGSVHTMHNVAAGFYDEDGYFHPIRASYDYDASRVGERSQKRRTRRKR